MPSGSWPTSSKDSGARILVTTNVGFMLLLAQKLQRDGLVDHLIVGDDTAFGPSAIPTTPIADAAGRRALRQARRRRRQRSCRGNGRR